MFARRDILSIHDLTKEEIDYVLSRAEELEVYAQGAGSGSRGNGSGSDSDLLGGKILANLFYEPSTRTRLSFEVAMKRLGGEVINLSSPDMSAAAKGENLVDTIRVVSKYCDIIALRHPKEGASRMAAAFSSVPIINAGDGAGQHPTQTLLDLYTIKKDGLLDQLKIALIGDLKYGRTVHSLVYALSLYGAKLFFVSPDALKIPADIKADLKEAGADISEYTDINEVIKEVNVLYLTRIQKERFPDPAEYNKVADTYRITIDLIKENEGVVIMHPLPKIDEIDAEVDRTENARYFTQAFYGIPVRMAVLYMLLSKRK
ncbi:MAG: aspartate carbamoyltransferase [Methanophagales archaeon]|nr:aspartate carbamoyltransferase [Methanophagales archaeon]